MAWGVGSGRRPLACVRCRPNACLAVLLRVGWDGRAMDFAEPRPERAASGGLSPPQAGLSRGQVDRAQLARPHDKLTRAEGKPADRPTQGSIRTRTNSGLVRKPKPARNPPVLDGTPRKPASVERCRSANFVSTLGALISRTERQTSTGACADPPTAKSEGPCDRETSRNVSCNDMGVHRPARLSEGPYWLGGLHVCAGHPCADGSGTPVDRRLVRSARGVSPHACGPISSCHEQRRFRR